MMVHKSRPINSQIRFPESASIKYPPHRSEILDLFKPRKISPQRLGYLSGPHNFCIDSVHTSVESATVAKTAVFATFST
jgi:hypothetical protein